MRLVRRCGGAPITAVILVAPTSFKAAFGAAEAAAAIAAGIREAAPHEPVLELPVSDGGPGLVDALAARATARWEVPATGPLDAPAAARVIRVGDAAVLESADACGLHLLPPERRDPLRATTFGVGTLLLRASALEGIREIACGLGGSATVDGGAGMARPLGFSLLDARGTPLPDGGGALERLARIVPPDPRPNLVPLTGLVDVRSPLLGPGGAAPVFGPQKGADAAGVARLERGLERLSACIRRDLGIDVESLSGGGAAGGLGAGLVAFAGATLRSGSDWVLDSIGFERELARARLVVTGEGAYDDQSALGKIAGEVVRRARAAHVPVLLVCGRILVALPPGVTGVDGGGEYVSLERLSAMAAEACARLLAP